MDKSRYASVGWLFFAKLFSPSVYHQRVKQRRFGFAALFFFKAEKSS